MSSSPRGLTPRAVVEIRHEIFNARNIAQTNEQLLIRGINGTPPDETRFIVLAARLREISCWLELLATERAPVAAPIDPEPGVRDAGRMVWRAVVRRLKRLAR